MPVREATKDDQYVLNHCARFLARHVHDDRHNFGQYGDGDPRAQWCEPWRFPIIDTHGGLTETPEARYRLNDVTFVYYDINGRADLEVGVVGTFGPLYEATPMRTVLGPDRTPTPYYAASVVVPKGEVHTYRYVVNGSFVVDPVNPQQVTLDSGDDWSRFFTQECTVPITFEHWERLILERLTDHILPFRTEAARNFLNRFYSGIDSLARHTEFRHAYRLDESVGVVNFIDKLVAREERHHLDDYRTCLRVIDGLLRQRNPALDPSVIARDQYVRLYDEMAAGTVPGWDYDRYGNPRFFLQLLRRHTLTGAFSHPRYGGNVLAAGWAYLQERYRDADGGTLFNWRKAIEAPLGDNTDYRG